MSLFQRVAPLKATYDFMRSMGADPLRVEWDDVLSPTQAVKNGRVVTLAGTHNYLGLTFDPQVVGAAIDSLQKHGAGTTGSRIANGTYPEHAAFERELADFFGMPHAMVFSTGFLANLGVLATVAGPDDVLLIDADSHASIYDACGLSKAQIVRFRHNSAEDLDKRLERLKGHTGNKIIVIEGIYSMLGDRGAMREIVAVKEKHGAYLIVDQAHCFGVLGENGLGLVEEVGMLDKADIIIGTFSKSLGCVGGFAVSNLPDFDAMRIVCRPYMFTASLPPSVMAGARAALNAIRTRPDLRAKLWRNALFLYDNLAQGGFKLGPEKTPIIAVELPSRELAIDTWRGLFDAGFYVNLALAPATPGGISLLRISVSAAHQLEQLQGLAEALTRVATSNGALATRLAAE